MSLSIEATVLIVPGLRGHVADHWQTLLGARRSGTRCVPPMGRDNLDCAARIRAIEREAQAIEGPLVLVAHSAGCLMLAHWAMQTQRKVHGALLATPPDFERPMPPGYPSMEALRACDWLPVPRAPLPFASITALSRNDPLTSFERASELALDWGSRLVDLGQVGHLNPASGFGEWPQAQTFIDELIEENPWPVRSAFMK
ncbi:MAG TPA: alpha/beta fold hydrolase [Steroidobacteraceae bacterium]